MWHMCWDLVFVPLGLLGQVGRWWGVKTRQVWAEFVGMPDRDNHCGFFSPGKANHYQPTMEAKSLTIYAQVQKSGVSSLFSLSGVGLFPRGIPGQSILQKALNFSVRRDYLLFEIMENTGYSSGHPCLHKGKMRKQETHDTRLLQPWGSECLWFPVTKLFPL